MKSGWRRLIPVPRNQRRTEQSGASETVDDEVFGVTEELIEFIKTFTVDTFKDFQLREDDGEENGGCDASPGTSNQVRTDLSDWQARHATLVLSKVKEISNLRYTLCPRHLKEHMFWNIYFRLVQRYVKKYEQHAIREEKIKKILMEKEHKAPKDNGFEVEMASTKGECSSSSSFPEDQP
ncbi:unnamed protein product [Rhodiola kirilowii]